MVSIERALREYYEEAEPDLLEEHEDELAHATELLREIYRQTVFPEMKADWKTHPSNAGHRDSLGCFRCHNDEMLDAAGQSMSTECSGCHAVLAQDDESIRAMTEFDRGMDFLHPQDSASFDDFAYCSDCHDGGRALYE